LEFDFGFGQLVGDGIFDSLALAIDSTKEVSTVETKGEEECENARTRML
jgi:hypothetical protein